MNRNIPTPLAILIILLVIAVIISLSFWLCPEKEIILPQNETIQDGTANWQTYRNEDYGFEMKYPLFLENGEPGCRINEVEDMIFIGPVSLMFFDAQGLTLDEWIDKKISESEEDTKETQERFKQAGYENWQEFGSKLLSRDEISVAGEKAVKLSYQFIGAGFDLPVTISVKRGDQIYEFRTNDANLVNEGCATKFEKKPSEAMELMLSTFKFIEEQVTADWQTYRNEVYGFEIKYPLEWLYNVVSEEHIEFGEKGKTYWHEESPIYAIGIFIDENHNNLTAEQIVEERKSKVSFPVEIKILTIDNTDAAQAIDYLQQRTIIVKNKRDYNIVTPYGLDKSVHEVYDKMLSTFRFIESDDDLLHKLFPNLEFNNGQAITLGDSEYGGMGLKLFLNKKIEDYFINKDEKSLLLIVSLEGVAHAGGLYHSYLGLFDLNGNLLTPFSSFPEPNFENDYFDDSYDFLIDEAQFGGDQGEFGFYDCNGVKYILFVAHGCPNGSCCGGMARLFRINNGAFEDIQIINKGSLTEIDAPYALRITLLDNKILIDKVPEISDGVCAETAYKELEWNENSCRFE